MNRKKVSICMQLVKGFHLHVTRKGINLHAIEKGTNFHAFGKKYQLAIGKMGSN